MMIKHKKRGPRCHFCNKFGHIQRNCHERERRLMLENRQTSHNRSKKIAHKINSVDTRSQHDGSDSDELGLVVQHVLSADVVKKSAGTNWIVDSGATCHVCNDSSLFIELHNLKNPLDIILGDGHTLRATRCGTVILLLKSGSLNRKCKLHDVLYVPELTVRTTC